jgi:hypothetical protein
MRIDQTFVPWATTWLYYFEDWLITDEWKGGGRHPDPADNERYGRRARRAFGAYRRRRKEPFERFAALAEPLAFGRQGLSDVRAAPRWLNLSAGETGILSQQ